MQTNFIFLVPLGSSWWVPVTALSVWREAQASGVVLGPGAWGVEYAAALCIFVVFFSLSTVFHAAFFPILQPHFFPTADGHGLSAPFLKNPLLGCLLMGLHTSYEVLLPKYRTWINGISISQYQVTGCSGIKWTLNGIFKVQSGLKRKKPQSKTKQTYTELNVRVGQGRQTRKRNLQIKRDRRGSAASCNAGASFDSWLEQTEKNMKK